MCTQSEPTTRNLLIHSPILFDTLSLPPTHSIPPLTHSLAHKLKIETGRYVKKEDKLPPSERICTLCKLQECEDEYHLMMKCDFYKKERELFMQNLTNLFPHIKSYSDGMLYKWLMANLNGNVLLGIGKFVHTCFKKRSLSISALSINLLEN